MSHANPSLPARGAAQPRTGRRAVEVGVRVLALAALVVAAVIHLRLAPQYQIAAPDGIGGGNLFRLQAVAALLVGVWLAWRGSRLAYAVAALVLFSALAALLLYTYVDVPPIGPIPSMYEPVWFTEKIVTAVAEGVGTLLALVGVGVARRRV